MFYKVLTAREESANFVELISLLESRVIIIINSVLITKTEIVSPSGEY